MWLPLLTHIPLRLLQSVLSSQLLLFLSYISPPEPLFPASGLGGSGFLPKRSHSSLMHMESSVSQGATELTSYLFSLTFNASYTSHLAACSSSPPFPPGELAPHFGRPLVAVFLQGTRDLDQSIRASSLSNLGELCQRLDFALGPLAQEVRFCMNLPCWRSCQRLK